MYAKILFIIIGLVALLSVYQYSFVVEKFSNSGYASLENPSKDLLLSCSYPMSSQPGLSSYDHSYAAEKKVLIPMGSYVQKTNNKRYWETPDNGTCPMTEFCGGLYREKNILDSAINAPNDSSIRVNFYNQ